MLIVAKEKFTKYALNENLSPDKARAFKDALGFTKENCDVLIEQIIHLTDIDKFKFKRHNKYGILYEQVVEIIGINGKTANVCTGWIKRMENKEISLTSVYVTKKKVSK